MASFETIFTLSTKICQSTCKPLVSLGQLLRKGETWNYRNEIFEFSNWNFWKNFVTRMKFSKKTGEILTIPREHYLSYGKHWMANMLLNILAKFCVYTMPYNSNVVVMYVLRYLLIQVSLAICRLWIPDECLN